MVRPSKKTQIPNLQEAIKETAWKQIAEAGAAAHAGPHLDDAGHDRGGRRLQGDAGGARAQRPLWASTSTKDPSYPDTLAAYMERDLAGEGIQKVHKIARGGYNTVVTHQRENIVELRLRNVFEHTIAKAIEV